MKSPSFNEAVPPRVCAVVPAAGKGTRLNARVPKVFVPILPTLTIWEAIHAKLAPRVDHIVLVLSPEGHRYLENNPSVLRGKNSDKTTLGLQTTPLGMGEAIFGAAPLWHEYEQVLIVWGDQFNLSPRTLQACLDLHAAQEKPALTLPLVRCAQPYVEYVFNPAGSLTQVRQQREGEACSPGGFSDLGVFLLSGGPALVEAWRVYREKALLGSVTGELNFLPFLVHLSSVAGWNLHTYETDDPTEALGINTADDLALAREFLQKKTCHE